ncbi:DNA/RNA helicase domain-containing protein [Streptomyces sp. NPDC051554]|uniref:DNA/RNA helicase domain-containing protein n=1 Tax=Streptomyces sp. NPDC051554 TaxID=3365656 RepID=UPI0037960C26
MLFRASAKTVAVMALDGSLFLHLTEQFVHMHGYQPGTSEVRSWERSIPLLTAALNDVGLGDVEVMLEYALPLNSKRADVVLAGLHPVTQEPSYVVVELKQWSQAAPHEDDPTLCHVDAYAHPVLNPVEQVRRYCEYLVNFNGAVAEHGERIHGVAFLHNATEFGVTGLREIERDEQALLFTGERRGAFLHHLRSRLSDKHPGARAADELLAGATVPSKQLMSVAAQEVRERQQFVLLDEQQVAYRMVLNAVERAKRADHKEVVIVTGGPGTGKSVIALQLLGELYRRGVAAVHATGSQSFTTTMRKVAGSRKREVQDLFKYFNSFMTTEKNSLGALICDEAHRIRETSANRYTRAALRTGRAQIDELIDVAHVPVFFLDEHQVVRPGEMGTVDEIREAAARRGIDCHVVPLESQFRCGGSDAYLRWVVRLLGLEPGGSVVWEPDDRMQLLVADSPEELEAFLDARRAEKYGARMSAGYCWRWSPEPKPGDPLPPDVVIGDWARPWNLRGDRSVSGAPPSALWATDPAGFGQIGCVYTAQGFEYDWSGVIIGPDLVWRGDRWITDRTASKDPVFKKAAQGTDVDRLIRNTYKVLLTRGMVGTIVYSTDPETREKLRELVSGRSESRPAAIEEPLLRR